jgi:hypothetical protein
MLTDHDPLDELVGALARISDDDLASPSESKPAAALFEEIVRTHDPRTNIPLATARGERSGRHRVRTIALLSAAVLVLGMAGSYATSQLLSPHEQLTAVPRLARDIPLPPGGNFDAVLGAISDVQPQQEEAGLAGGLAFAAACQWYGYWLDGFNRGDAAQMSAALRTIDEIPTWPQLVEVGSGPGGTVNDLKRLAATTDSGSPDPVRQFITANCTAEPWGDAAAG